MSVLSFLGLKRRRLGFASGFTVSAEWILRVGGRGDEREIMDFIRSLQNSMVFGQLG